MKLVFATAQLMEASDYRGFLSILYKTNKEASAQFSYAYIAKQCGFSSKSFIKEVIDGKKRLTLESTHKLIDGLPLPSLWGKYFFYLVVNDEKLQTADKVVVPKELNRLRQRLGEKKNHATTDNQGSRLFQMMHWPHVYAAMGTADKGATFQEIENRTQLSTSVITETLNLLSQENMIELRGRRYFAKTDSAFFEGLGKSHFFKNYYTHSVGLLFDKSRKNFDSQDSLFYSMSLSLNPQKMPHFKKDLADLLDKYTADVEDAQGSRVASLTCGFHLV